MTKDEIKDKIIELQDEYIKIADKILGEWETSYVPLTELRRELYSLKSQLSEAGEEKKECSSCQWVKIGYGHCEWCLRNTSYNNELSLKTSGYADNWQSR